MPEGSLLTEKGVYTLLQNRILVSCSKDANKPVEISTFNEEPEEAIQMANAIAASLQIQLIRSSGTTKSAADVRIQNATKAERVRPWFTYLPKKLIIVVPLCIIAAVLLRVARLMPPSIPMPPNTGSRIHFKY